MKSLFDSNDRAAVVARIEALRPESMRVWGKMDVAQMLRHCSIALETGTGERPMKQKLIGKILMPFIRKSIFGEKPFSRNGPTDPTYVIADERDFAVERKRLLDVIQLFVGRGEAEVAKAPHPFFGRMTGQEWGQVMYKHLDHHLQQFGV
jgi:hypothetical protein